MLLPSGIRIRPPSRCVRARMMMGVRGMIPGRNQHMPRHGGSRHSSQQRTAPRRVADRGRGRRRTDLTAKPATSETGDLGLCFECFRGLALACPSFSSTRQRSLAASLPVSLVTVVFCSCFYDDEMRGIYNSIIQVHPNMLSFLMR